MIKIQQETAFASQQVSGILGSQARSESPQHLLLRQSKLGPAPPTPMPVSAAIFVCTHCSGVAGTSLPPHISCRSSSFVGVEVLLQPWQPESCSAPHCLLSLWQQPLAQAWRSSVSHLTTNLTALRKSESKSVAIPYHGEMTPRHIIFLSGSGISCLESLFHQHTNQKHVRPSWISVLGVRDQPWQANRN